MRVYGAMNAVGLGHVVWRVSSVGFWADGFCLVARVRTKDKVCKLEGTKFARTKLAVADSICVCIASVLAGNMLLGSMCVACVCRC